MAYILNIETATSVCSVSLFYEKKLLSHEEIDDGYTHAENLHQFISAVMDKAGLSLNKLDAIAVSKGPGSYTGLRIGVSAAKGLTFGLNIPLLAIDTLKTMSMAALDIAGSQSYFCPMIDARRMEVYYSVFDQNKNQLVPIEALVIDEVSARLFSKYKTACFFGNGMPKLKSILQRIGDFTFVDSIVPSAKYMGALAFEKFTKSQFEDVAYFEPFYLKNYIAGKKKVSH